MSLCLCVCVLWAEGDSVFQLNDEGKKKKKSRVIERRLILRPVVVVGGGGQWKAKSTRAQPTNERIQWIVTQPLYSQGYLFINSFPYSVFSQSFIFYSCSYRLVWQLTDSYKQMAALQQSAVKEERQEPLTCTTRWLCAWTYKRIKTRGFLFVLNHSSCYQSSLFSSLLLEILKKKEKKLVNNLLKIKGNISSGNYNEVFTVRVGRRRRHS